MDRLPANIGTLYSLYVQIRKTDLPRHKQYLLTRALLACEEWTWRVEGISVEALKKIKYEYNFKKKTGVVRGHITPFRETAKAILDTIMPVEEWCKLVYENEKVRLMTREENNSESVSDIIPIERVFCGEILFRNNRCIGYRYRKLHEAVYLRALADKHLP